MSSSVAAVLLPAALAIWQSGEAAQSTPSPEEISRTVEELGDEEFLVRQRASQLLWEAGERAESALTRAAESPDPEVAVRARRILRNFKYGIYPDTPEEVVLLIERFRQGNPDSKLAAVRELMDMAAVSTLLKLLQTLSDETLRQQLTQGLVRDIDKLAGAMFIVGQWDKAEQFLEIGAVGESGMRNYAAYFLLRGGLDDKIAELQERLARAPTAPDARRLAYLLRARGDLPEALAAAEKSEDAVLVEGLLMELGQWQRLARNYDELGRDADGQPAGGIVHLGYTAAFHRLAGDAEKFEQTVGAIKDLARRKPNKLWYCGEALLINQRFEDAMELVRDDRAESALEILCLQCRFREGLKLAGIDDPRGSYSPWFAASGTGTATDSAARRQRFDLGLSVAAVLHRLGEREKALRLLDELAEMATDEKDISMRPVCETEFRLGLTDRAFEHVAVVFAEDSERWNTSVLWSLFPGHEAAAETWWQFLREKHGNEPCETTIDRLRKLLPPGATGVPPGATGVSPGATGVPPVQGANHGQDARGTHQTPPGATGVSPGATGVSPVQGANHGQDARGTHQTPPDKVPEGSDDVDWQGLVDEAENAAAALQPETRGKWLTALGETCLAHGKRSLAQEYFEKAAEAAPSVESLLRPGDMAAEDGRWQQAADWYGRAWNRDHAQPSALHLQGWTLTKTGREAEGRKLIEAARLLPLGNAETRYYLAADLHRRGLTEEAMRQWELTVRTGEFHSWPVNQAAEQLGNRLVGKDDLQAAAYWRWPLLRCLRSSTTALGVEGYLRWAHEIHKARARGFLAAGQIDRAIEAIHLSHAALPGEIGLALELVPRLQQAGRKQAADELFAAVYGVNARVCEDFPQSATHRNNLAQLEALSPQSRDRRSRPQSRDRRLRPQSRDRWSGCTGGPDNSPESAVHFEKRVRRIVGVAQPQEAPPSGVHANPPAAAPHLPGYRPSSVNTAAQARRKYSAYSHAPLPPVWRVTTRSRLGTSAISCPPEPGL